MAEEIVHEQPDIPAVEPAAPVEKAQPEKEPKKLSLREQLKESIKIETEKAERARDETGKFVKAAPKEAAAEVSLPEEPKPKKEPSSALEPPSGWSKEAKELWSSLPPSVQSDAVRREQEAAKGIEEYRTKLKNFEPIGQIQEKHTQYFQQIGVPLQQYLENAISWDQALRNPQTRAAAIREFIQSYGIDPSTLAPLSPNSQEQIPPQIAPYLQQIGSVAQEVNSIKSQLQRSQEEKISSELTAFAKDHPHFEKVRAAMGQLIQAGAVPPNDLEGAYQRAIWMDESLRKIMIDEAAEKQMKEAQERAKKAHQAAISAQSRAPVGTVTNGTGKPKGVRGSINAAIEELREKQRA